MTFEEFYWVKSKVTSIALSGDHPVAAPREDNQFENPSIADEYDGLTSSLLQVPPGELAR